MHAARCLVPRYFDKRWDALGHTVMCFWLALLTSVFSCDFIYDGRLEDMCFNVLVAFYMACGNHAMIKKIHGKNWKSYAMPEITLAHAMANAGNFVSRCLHYPPNVPFRMYCQGEDKAEKHFSACKEPFRGMPREKDMIHGASRLILMEHSS